MSRTEELIAKCQAGDMEAKEAIITENSGLIWSITRRFLGRGTEADDIYQLACLGFLIDTSSPSINNLPHGSHL